jgi:hypothetical protein
MTDAQAIKRRAIAQPGDPAGNTKNMPIAQHKITLTSKQAIAPTISTTYSAQQYILQAWENAAVLWARTALYE